MRNASSVVNHYRLLSFLVPDIVVGLEIRSLAAFYQANLDFFRFGFRLIPFDFI